MKLPYIPFLILTFFLITIIGCESAEDANMHLGDTETDMVESKVTSAQYQPDFNEYSQEFPNDSSFFGYDINTDTSLDKSEFIQNFYSNMSFNTQNKIFKNESYRYYESWHGGEGWNTDNNVDTTSVASKPDFQLSGEELFLRWDVDGNGRINEAEYRRGIFNWYDKDRDGRLSQQEFNALRNR